MNLNTKVCCVFNVGATYRAPIYHLMDEILECDFFIGDDTGAPLKRMDYHSLKGFATTLHNVRIGPFTWRKGYRLALRAEYSTFIMTGEPNCITDWFIMLWAFFKKKKTLLWCHGWYGKESFFTRMIKKFQFWLSTGIILYGERARNLLIGEGIKPEKMFVVHNSLDYSEQISIRQSLRRSRLYQDHFGNDNKNIVFIGRLTTVKRLDLLIEAASILKSRGDTVNVTFIGDGVERQNLEALAYERSMQNEIWFYGACYDERINAEMVFNADLCVSPGNIGLTAIHVLTFGCPAITNDDFSHQMPEFEAIQKDETGDFFKVGDSFVLADTISSWFDKHRNDRDRIRQNCYAIIDSGWNPAYQIKVFRSAIEYANNH